MFPFPFPSPGDDRSPSTGLGGFGSGGIPPLSFNFRHINWLAHLFGNTLVFPDESQVKEVSDAARQYLFWLAQHGPEPARDLAFRVITDLRIDFYDYSALASIVGGTFSRLPWRALLIPGGLDSARANVREIYFTPGRADEILTGQYSLPERPGLDDQLTSRKLIEAVFEANPRYAGLIFHLGSAAGRTIYLDSIFPALKVAFARATEWPGVLLWRTREDVAVFHPLNPEARSVQSEVNSIFNFISLQQDADTRRLREFLLSNHTRLKLRTLQKLNIIHTSDMHLGSEVADSRLPTVKTRIQHIAGALKTESRVLPVVTGDLMDTPNTKHLNSVQDYMHFLDTLGTERPLIVPGNHDVRHMGVFGEKFDEVMRLYMKPVAFVDDCKVGLVCFNSVRGGNLARGSIDDREFASLGHELDMEQARSSSYFLLAMLHHHPCPVERPDWYSRTWYERWLGKWFEHTDALEDAPLFLEWVKQRKIAAVLHGHKHIPRVTWKDGVSVIGCGSTVGKVPTDAIGRTFMSINIITIDVEAGRLSCRVMAERILGAGLATYDSHEILFRDLIALRA